MITRVHWKYIKLDYQKTNSRWKYFAFPISRVDYSEQRQHFLLVCLWFVFVYFILQKQSAARGVSIEILSDPILTAWHRKKWTSLVIYAIQLRTIVLISYNFQLNFVRRNGCSNKFNSKMKYIVFTAQYRNWESKKNIVKNIIEMINENVVFSCILIDN